MPGRRPGILYFWLFVGKYKLVSLYFGPRKYQVSSILGIFGPKILDFVQYSVLKPS